MFFELRDWDYDKDTWGNECLINLDEVLQINKELIPTTYRNSKTGKNSEYFRLKVYYTGKGNSWGFYYPTQAMRDKAYFELLAVLNKNALLAGGDPKRFETSEQTFQPDLSKEDWTKEYLK